MIEYKEDKSIRVKNEKGEFFFNELQEALHYIKCHFGYISNFISQKKGDQWIPVSTEWPKNKQPQRP